MSQIKTSSRSVASWLMCLCALALTGLLASCGGSSGTSDVPPWVGTKQMGAQGEVTYGNSVAVDANGNVYIAGQTYGGLDGNTLMGLMDLFLTKYNSSGVKQYTKQLGVPSSTSARYQTAGSFVTTDASGNVYITGYTTGGLDGNMLTGTYDFYLTKFNSSGAKQFTKQLGAPGKSTIGQGVATDASGNIYVTGYTDGGLDGNALTGSYDLFLIKYNSSGEKQYTKQIGVQQKQTYGNSVATDASGNVYVTGNTNGGQDGNPVIGNQDLFVIKFNSSGVKQYTKQIGVAGKETYGNSVTTDTRGNVYVTGDTSGGLEGSPLTGTRDVFLIKFNSIGEKQYTKQWGVTGLVAIGNSVTSDSSGNVYVTGYTTGGLDGNALTGNQDFFLTKFNGNGEKQFTKLSGVQGKVTGAWGVATDASSNVFVAGDTNAGLDGNTLTGTNDFFLVKFNSSGIKQ